MRLAALSQADLSDFIKYCKSVRDQVDDSYLYEEDLREFSPNEENPTYVVFDNENKMIAVASLIIDAYFRQGKRGRFRIFHSIIHQAEIYKMLLEAVLFHTQGLDKVFLFVDQKNQALGKELKQLGFDIERYSYVLERDDLPVTEPVFDGNYELKDFQFDRDEKDWMEVRNAGFAKLAGAETPITLEMVKKMAQWDDHIEGGMKVLYHLDRPVGIVRTSKEFGSGEYTAFLALLAVIPEYQGKGLGRELLRAGLSFAKNQGLEKAFISVNAENERAVELYLQEGFKEFQVKICYRYQINKM